MIELVSVDLYQWYSGIVFYRTGINGLVVLENETGHNFFPGNV